VASAKSANAEARMKFLQQQVEVFSRFTGEGSSPEKAVKKKKPEGGGLLCNLQICSPLVLTLHPQCS